MLYRIEIALLRPGRLRLTAARLILATGSRAGLEAPLQLGYYMIGRHRECQIRPKSRSVSRRHCLIQLDNDGVRVIDLNSSSGTYVDDQKLQPRTWVTLGDGQTLRCGKILFRASIEVPHAPAAEESRPIEASPPELTPAEASQTEAIDEVETGSMLTGEAWQDVDVASFLDVHDEADRERRYGTIRAKNAADQAALDEESQQFDSDVDLDLFEDASDTEEFASSPSPATDSSDSNRRNAMRSNKSMNSPRSGKHRRPPSLPKKQGKRRFASGVARGSGSSLRGLANAGLWKVVAAAVFTVAVLGFFGFSAYQFYTGPPVRVLHDID